MKNALVQLSLVIIGISSIHAARLLQTSSFHLRMLPADGADRIWAIQGRDSMEMMKINGEYILRSVKPGYWQVLVEANQPYRDARFTVHDIRPGTDRDLGVIRLRIH
jgi:hypothetical protein